MISYIKQVVRSNYLLKKSKESVRQGNIKMASQYYMLALSVGAKRDLNLERRLQEQCDVDQNQDSLKIAVAGWDLSHNAAGRAVTLADLYQYAGFDDVSLIGAIIQNASRSKQVWSPIKQHKIPCFTYEIDGTNIDLMLPVIIRFVINHPFDIVHLSKPRITNIILGILYQKIWGTKVILDIDDEELAFTGSDQTANSWCSYPKAVRDIFWTRYAVDCHQLFQYITVSNPALQARYGGIIIPHVRDERIFQPDSELRQKSRAELGINDSDVVVLFFGTPKRHKGLVEVAQAISTLQNPRPIFMIVGDFVDKELKQDLLAVAGVRYIFLPNQPYVRAKDVVAMGDICVLMQDVQNQIAKYQLPAKSIDALAMGLKIFLQKTPATESLFADDYVSFVSVDILSDMLQDYLQNYKQIDDNRRWMQHEYFRQYFSLQAYQKTAKCLAEKGCHYSRCNETAFSFLHQVSRVKQMDELVCLIDDFDI